MTEKPADDKQPGVNRLTGHKRNIPTNLGGRPKGSKNRVKDALDKQQRDPVLELVKISDLLRGNPPEHQRKALEADMKIWMELLEYKQAKKKASPKGNEDRPEASKEAAEATFDLLKELEKETDVNPGATRTSNTPSVADGKLDIQVEAGSEEDLQDDQGQ